MRIPQCRVARGAGNGDGDTWRMQDVGSGDPSLRPPQRLENFLGCDRVMEEGD